jgi:C2 domain-containing protein 3
LFNKDVSSNGSLVSGEEDTDDTPDTTGVGRRNNHFGRVSFEIQSSDGESGFSNATNTINEKCMDILSPQRLSLLNLVQVAKLKIEKINLFSTHNASTIMSKVNKIEQKNQRDESKSTNKSAKPPIPGSPTNGRKNEIIGQSFFIEYQFPVTANTRENEESNYHDSDEFMATQIMRVNTSKRCNSMNTDENIVFENLAEYSVLFNSYSLETWWKSVILFKIYCRPSVVTTATQPFLVGIARLDLKNVLKSRNFKLYKKIAIYDQLGNENKRIGTLHTKIELWSNLKEFNYDLAKLRNFETKLNSKAKIFKKNKVLQSSNNKRIKNTSPSPIATKIDSNTIEEFSLPIQMFLTINEGRGFSSILKQTNLNQSKNIFLVCRLFWNKEKVKFDVENYGDSHFSWTLNLSLMIKPSMIENMRNNFMIIEAWEKNEKQDSFIGTVKLSLHEFYLKFKDLKLFRQFLKDDSLQPSIGVDGWIGVCDPFTGIFE